MGKSFSQEVGLLSITFWSNYGLRACDEHCNLEVSHYEIGEDERGTYMYLRFKRAVIKYRLAAEESRSYEYMQNLN